MAIIYGDYPLKKKTSSSAASGTGSGSRSSYDRRNGTADELYTPKTSAVPKAAPSKTIDDYKRDYAAAAARGDAAGMKAANDGANAIRTAQGQAAQVASNDIAKVQSGGTSGMVSNPGRYNGSSSVRKAVYTAPVSTPGRGSGAASYTPSYTQSGTDSYGKTIADYSRDYNDAKARGDAAGMQLANDRANAIRRAAGQQEQYATADINKVAGGQYQQYYANNDLRGVGNLYLGTMATNERNLDAAEAAGNTIRLEDYIPNIRQIARNTNMDLGVAIDMFVNNIRHGRAVDGGDVGVDYAALQKLYNSMGSFNMNTEVNRLIREYLNNGLFYDPGTPGYGEVTGVGVNRGTGVTRDPVTGQLVPNPTGTAGQTAPFTGAGNGSFPAIPAGTGGLPAEGSAFPDAYGASGLLRDNLYTQFLEQMDKGYDAAGAQQQAALDAAVRQAVLGLTGQKDDLEQQYSDLYRQLYINRRMAEKNLPQQMAAMGYTGGLTESSALGLQTAYTDALRQGEQEKLGTLNEIDRAIADARLTGDINKAQQAAQLALDRLSAYGNVIDAIQQQNNWAAEFGYRQAQDALAQQNWQAQFDYSKSMDQQNAARQQLLDEISRSDVAYARKLELAQYLYENTGDASGFAALGYDAQQIAALQSNYAAALAASRKSSSTGYTRDKVATEDGIKPPSLITQSAYDAAADRFDAGDYSTDVIETMLAAGDQPEKLASAAGLTPNVMNLGMGPLSQSAIAQYVANGQLIAVEMNGVRYYKWANGKPGQLSGLYGSLGALAQG